VNRLLAIALLGSGCAPAPPAQPDLPPPAPAPGVPTDPWVLAGQVGDLTIIRQEANVSTRRTLRLAAVFADDLQGLPWPAACEFSDRLCLPEGAESEVRIDTSAVALDPERSRFSWLGDAVWVGDLAAGFDVDPAHPVGGYAGRDFSTGLLLPRYPLEFSGGEWGDYQAESVVPLPDKLTTFSPPTDQPVELDGDRLANFRWAPTGQGQMVLSMSGPGWSSARLLEDDGEVWVDTSDLRFSDPIDVRLQRITTAGSVAIGDNELVLHTLAEQGWCLYDRCDLPVTDPLTPLVFEFCWSTTSCGDGRWLLAPDGTWRTDEGYIGSWEYDCCNERIDILFSSGTRYTGERDENGCFVGQMESWSGNTGDWMGCL